MLTRLRLQNFTAFSTLDMRLSPGINIFIGTNGTGKTHILKLLYAACDVTQSQEISLISCTMCFSPTKDVWVALPIARRAAFQP